MHNYINVCVFATSIFCGITLKTVKEKYESFCFSGKFEEKRFN